MRIGVVQMTSVPDKHANLSLAENVIKELAENGCELVVLPEYATWYGPRRAWPENAEELDSSQSMGFLRDVARRYKVALHCGSFLERKDDRIFNTSVVFAADGSQLALYRKIHLCDIHVPGGQRFMESAVLSPGDSLSIFVYQGITFGLATCYDLRFPELFRGLADRGCEVILFPSAFAVQTGMAHWQVLLRARAVENLCYLVAADQVGEHCKNLVSYGKSMIVDPWGKVLCQLADDSQTAFVDCDIEGLRELRLAFPVLDHRKM